VESHEDGEEDKIPVFRLINSNWDRSYAEEPPKIL